MILIYSKRIALAFTLIIFALMDLQSKVDSTFVEFTNKFKTINLPYKIDIMKMKSLLNSYTPLKNNKKGIYAIDSYIPKIKAKIFGITEDSLLQRIRENEEYENDSNSVENFYYYPLGKFKIDSLLVTMIIYIGEEYDSTDESIYSLGIYLYIFDQFGKYYDYLRISEYLNKRELIFSMESIIKVDGTLKITNKLFSEKKRNKIESISEDIYKFNKDSKKFTIIRSK